MGSAPMHIAHTSRQAWIRGLLVLLGAVVALALTVILMLPGLRGCVMTHVQSPVRLTAFPGARLTAQSLAVSPDGNRIAFILRPSWGSWGSSARPGIIGIVPVGGGEPKWINAGMRVASHWLSWSPTSAALAFAGFPEDAREPTHITVYDVKSGVVRAITDSPGYSIDKSPQWSPTGEWIAYRRLDGRGCDTWIVRPDGSEVRKVTSNALLPVIGGHWSADGRNLYYVRKDPRNRLATRGDAWVVGIDEADGTARRLTSGMEAGYVRPSRDGQYLYCHIMPEEGPSSIRVLPVGDPTRPAAVVSAGYSPMMSPDGHWLAFLDNQRPGDRRLPTPPTYELWKMSLVQPGQRRKLADGVRAPATLGWTADGEIVFSRGTSIWAVTDDGTKERQILALPDYVEVP